MAVTVFDGDNNEVAAIAHHSEMPQKWGGHRGGGGGGSLLGVAPPEGRILSKPVHGRKSIVKAAPWPSAAERLTLLAEFSLITLSSLLSVRKALLLPSSRNIHEKVGSENKEKESEAYCYWKLGYDEVSYV